jgi:cation diffusion facilitator family transporter
MHTHSLNRWRHDHVFGQDAELPSERRLRLVVGVTALVMALEIVAGVVFGSMALLADGLHMATHVLALGLAVFAYRATRARAGDARLSFGSGKLNALGGFSSALLLAGVAAAMLWACVVRMTAPVAIDYGQAMAVAVLGLAVNLASVLILGHDHGHDHHHDHDHDHDHDHHHHHDHVAAVDHNHRAAYVHVLADALTSVLAIAALACAWGSAPTGWTPRSASPGRC